jgi:hypothetical protein
MTYYRIINTSNMTGVTFGAGTCLPFWSTWDSCRSIFNFLWSVLANCMSVFLFSRGSMLSVLLRLRIILLTFALYHTHIWLHLISCIKLTIKWKPKTIYHTVVGTVLKYNRKNRRNRSKIDILYTHTWHMTCHFLGSVQVLHKKVAGLS